MRAIYSFVGMSGVGKSHWSKKLAELGYDIYSIDDLIGGAVSILQELPHLREYMKKAGAKPDDKHHQPSQQHGNHQHQGGLIKHHWILVLGNEDGQILTQDLTEFVDKIGALEHIPKSDQTISAYQKSKPKRYNYANNEYSTSFNR